MYQPKVSFLATTSPFSKPLALLLIKVLSTSCVQRGRYQKEHNALFCNTLFCILLFVNALQHTYEMKGIGRARLYYKINRLFKGRVSVKLVCHRSEDLLFLHSSYKDRGNEKNEHCCLRILVKGTSTCRSITFCLMVSVEAVKFIIGTRYLNKNNDSFCTHINLAAFKVHILHEKSH